MKTTSVSPILQVADLKQSLSFYCDVLGFTKEFAYGEPPFYGGVKLGEVILHLCTSAENDGRRGRGSAYVFCDEVDAYYGEVTGRGVEVTSRLETYPYGMRDFQVKDPDGNLICFGAPVAEEE